MTETASEAPHGLFTCDNCGKTDTDPMIHVPYATWRKNGNTIVVEPSFHFDCLPAEFRPGLVGPQNAVTAAAVEAAESGVHGDDLRAFIAEQPDDNNIEPEAAAS